MEIKIIKLSLMEIYRDPSHFLPTKNDRNIIFSWSMTAIVMLKRYNYNKHVFCFQTSWTN